MKYKGHELAPLRTIARRLLCYPFFIILKVLIVLVAYLAWGKYCAQQMWRDLS